MIVKLATVTLVALFSLSGPQSAQDEIAALRKEVADLKAQQAAMQRDLETIKTYLQALSQGRQGADPLMGRQLSGLFHGAGLAGVETGLLGEQVGQKA